MNKGYTLIELVISIFVLSIAVIGVYSVFSAMLVLTSDSADRLVAIYLAQEGAEIVRNMRDNTWLEGERDGEDWLYKFADCTNGCNADYTTGTGISGETVLHQWQIGDDANYLKMVGSLYRYSETTGVVKTKFKRKIKISRFQDNENNNLDFAVKVVVEASWDQKATIFRGATLASECESNCIAVEYILYNWY